MIPVSGWSALIPSLHRNKGDLIAGGFTDTESRRKLIGFTVEAFPTSTWSRLVVKYFGESAVDLLKNARTR